MFRSSEKRIKDRDAPDLSVLSHCAIKKSVGTHRRVNYVDEDPLDMQMSVYSCEHRNTAHMQARLHPLCRFNVMMIP